MIANWHHEHKIIIHQKKKKERKIQQIKQIKQIKQKGCIFK